VSYDYPAADFDPPRDVGAGSSVGGRQAPLFGVGSMSPCSAQAAWATQPGAGGWNVIRPPCGDCVELVALLPYTTPTRSGAASAESGYKPKKGWRRVSRACAPQDVSLPPLFWTLPTRNRPHSKGDAMFGLPFQEIWALDFEFIAPPGALPAPVCMVARELRTNRLIRLWQDELAGTEPPFPVGDESLFAAFYASAELGCFLALGWPLPTRVLDLYAEFRNASNGISLPIGRSLLGALSHYGIPAVTAEQKTEDRELVMRGGPWTPAERRRILDYCTSDVDCLGPLLERMLPGITATPKSLGQALLRGRYTAAVARMEHTGVPIDTAMLGSLRANWQGIKGDLVAAVDKDYGVYEGTSFRAGLFAGFLHDNGIDWPRTATGRLQLDRDTFRDMAKRYPRLEPLKDLRHTLSELRLEKLAVGPDGRNRVLLSPFGASSGRNTPSNSKFIFGPSVWLRGLIKPTEGQALAYIDWSSQEVYIAAALSGDTALLNAVTSGDPYLWFARMAGLAPPEATKLSHKAIRDLCKTCFLGSNYGMQSRSLAARTGLSVIEADDLLRRLARAFPVFTAWADHVPDVGQLAGYLSTVFGWKLITRDTPRPTTLRNFPVQANGAEMLRLACCLATEAGVKVCAPVHDAVLIEAGAGEIGDAVAVTRAAMAEASRVVLGGLEVDTDVEIIAWPDRYADDRGRVMWERISELLMENVPGQRI
jgi:DNA polymerase family A